MNREPILNDLIGTDATGAERQRLQHVHELLLEAGPLPELTPELEAGPTLGMTLSRRRRAAKPRAMLLLAAAVMVLLIFFAGYAVGDHGGKSVTKPVIAQAFKGTSLAPNAEGSLQVWNSTTGNWPMTLRVAGLPKLPPHTYYEVYLVRHGKPWGSCGTFRVGSSSSSGQAITVTLTAPYSLEKGDSWIVTRPGRDGAEPGQTVLSPVKA